MSYDTKVSGQVSSFEQNFTMEMKKDFEGDLEAKKWKTDDQDIYIRKWEGR